MTNPTPNVSVVRPVDAAVERVKLILFRPFDFGKWMAIGFCAWLATLGEGGSSFNNFNQSSSPGKVDLSQTYDQARDYVIGNLAWIIPLAAFLLVFILALVAVLAWLTSRGRFMFLHCVALNRDEVSVPWRKYASQAKSLWLFRLILAAAGIFVILPLVLALVVIVFDLVVHAGQLQPMLLAVLIVMALVFFSLSIPLGLIRWFTTDFVVPIMFLRGGTCTEAWRVLLDLLRANPGHFVLYVLFRFALGIGIGFLVLMAVVCTCCIAGCLMLLPFLGSVVLLPVTVFKRSYSLYYLAQYGPEFDAFHPSFASSSSNA